MRRVIDAHQVQHGCIEIMDVNGVLYDVVGVVVGFTDRCAFFHTCSGEPDGEAAGMVVAAIILLGQCALRVHGAAKLPAPDDERILEQAAPLQVLDERCGRLVGVVALGFDAVNAVGVLVPAAAIELNEAHAALGQPPGKNAMAA
jgi:hypothetical protein